MDGSRFIVEVVIFRGKMRVVMFMYGERVFVMS